MAYFVYQNLFIDFNAYFKSLIKKISMSLGCPYYYLLLFHYWYACFRKKLLKFLQGVDIVIEWQITIRMSPRAKSHKQLLRCLYTSHQSY